MIQFVQFSHFHLCCFSANFVIYFSLLLHLDIIQLLICLENLLTPQRRGKRNPRSPVMRSIGTGLFPKNMVSECSFSFNLQSGRVTRCSSKGEASSLLGVGLICIQKSFYLLYFPLQFVHTAMHSYSSPSHG